MNKKIRNERGITLIVLVITIFVLLILSGVTFNALSGENGIITRAKDAKQKVEETNVDEQINLAVLSAITSDMGTLTIKSI